MESKLTLDALNNISEIDIVYKRKANCKMSDRPEIISSMDCADVLCIIGTKTK
jgi:hypothetical protein